MTCCVPAGAERRSALVSAPTEAEMLDATSADNPDVETDGVGGSAAPSVRPSGRVAAAGASGVVEMDTSEPRRVEKDAASAAVRTLALAASEMADATDAAIAAGAAARRVDGSQGRSNYDSNKRSLSQPGRDRTFGGSDSEDRLNWVW